MAKESYQCYVKYVCVYLKFMCMPVKLTFMNQLNELNFTNLSLFAVVLVTQTEFLQSILLQAAKQV